MFSMPRTASADELAAQPAGDEAAQASEETVSSLGIVHGKQFHIAAQRISEELKSRRKRQAAKPPHPMEQQFNELSAYLDEKMEDWNGSEKWAVTVILEDGKLSGSFGCEEQMASASLIKLFVAGACMQQSEEEGVSESLLRSMDTMISFSDNEACNALIRHLGMDSINAFIKKEGFSETVLRRRMLEARTSSNENLTTAADCGWTLFQILHGTYVSEDASARILDDLEAQERRWKIPSGLPEGTRCANKTGELDDVENDAAIIWGEKTTYILCIMSENVSPGKAQERIRELSAEIYRILND